MMWLLHSGILSFTVALFITVLAIKTWLLARNPVVAVMNASFVMMNIGLAFFQISAHPEIWM